MAFQISALVHNIRICVYRGPQIRSNIQRAGFRFKHISSPGGPRLGEKLAARPVRGPPPASPRKSFSTMTETPRKPGQGTGSSSHTGGRGTLGKLAVGAAVGASTVALVQCFHTETLAAMAQKVDLNSPEGDWRKIKANLLSLSVTQRREYYRTKDYVPLENIPVWTSTAGSSKQSKYPRNAKLDKKISVYRGDITMLEIDAIVNAANKTLLGGGGVDGAIHRAAGPMLKKECASLNGCETGQAKITCGYGLPAKYVIHTVGPIAKGGVREKEEADLRSCYKNSLEVATKGAARSVAFPCISTGIYGYPPDKAVHEALATVREYLNEHHDKVDRVIFCVFSPMDKELYLQNLPLYFPPDEPTVKSKL